MYESRYKKKGVRLYKITSKNNLISYLSKMMQDSIKSSKDCTENRVPNLGVHEIHQYDWSPDSSNSTSIVLD